MGANLHRVDASNIQFLVNQKITAGLANADGQIWITGDSDPVNAIGAALATWSGVPTSAVRFAAQRSTAAVNNASDRQHVMVFSDTPDIRSILGDAVAITAIYYVVADGAITDTDIIFNPRYTFSTTFADDTMDLQSVVTHELGHALGANHTNVLGAAMFQSGLANDNCQASLSSDDIAFVSSLYPASGGNGFATVAGRAALEGGQPLRGGMVTALNPSNGVTVSGFTSLADGSFRFQAPVGDYLLYVEPLGGYVSPGNLYVPAGVAVDTNFQSSFLGSNRNPTLLTLTLGPEVNVTLQASAGSASFRTPLIGIGRAGGSEGATFYQGPVNVSSGQSADLLIAGEGIDPLTEANLEILRRRNCPAGRYTAQNSVHRPGLPGVSSDRGHRAGHASHARHHRSQQRFGYSDVDWCHRSEPAAGRQRRQLPRRSRITRRGHLVFRIASGTLDACLWAIRCHGRPGLATSATCPFCLTELPRRYSMPVRTR